MSAIESSFSPGDAVADMLGTVRLPLENMEFTIEQYLLANGTRLDPETRYLLAGLRDTIGQVATSTRRIAEAEHRALPPPEG